VLPGVRGTYDRYQYFSGKKHAFDALAGLIARIIDAQDNVVVIHCNPPPITK
jgi:hypothetical protein